TGDEDDALARRRTALVELAEEASAVHHRHLRVGHERVVAGLRQHVERHGAVRGDLRLVAVAADGLRHHLGYAGLVVHDEDAPRPDRRRRHGAAAAGEVTRGGTTTGSSRPKVVPRPATLSTVLVP